MDQDDYKSTYETYLLETINEAFNPAKMKEIYQYYHNLVSDYVIGTNSEQDGYTFLNSSSEFTDALNQQFDHVDERYNLVQEYLSK